MDFQWPVFQDEPIGDGRTWSGTFDSFDQHLDDCYYVIVLSEGGKETARFMVRAGLGWVAEGESTSPTFESRLREQLQRLASTGKTNTDYTGPVFRNP